jgi:hypothetical protein
MKIDKARLKDANGHPIWWNGTAWVDAQGALV